MSYWKSLASDMGTEFGKAIFLAVISEITGNSINENVKPKAAHKERHTAHTNIQTDKFHYRSAIERFDRHMTQQGFKNMHKSKRNRSQIMETWYNHKTGTTMIGHFHLN